MNVAERMQHFNVPGVGVAHFDKGKNQGKFYGVREKGTGKAVDENTIFHACSISKMVTAICVLGLAQQGDLDLHKDVNEYLTTWKVPESELIREKKVTLANLLAHQGGFCDCEDSFGTYKTGDKAPSAADILGGGTPYHPQKVEVKYAPETDWEYSDAGYCIISQVLLDVLGETVPQIAKWMIFEPLGLKRTFFWEPGKDTYEDVAMDDCAAGHDNDGEIVEETRAAYPNIEGAGLWTTPGELAAIVMDIIKSYQGKGGVVLSQDMARLMLTPYGCVPDQGLGVFLDTDERGRPYFYSQGWGIGMQCKLRVYYQDESGVVVMTNSEPGMEQDESLVGEIIFDMCGK